MSVLTAGEIATLRATHPTTLFAMRCTIERPTAGADDPWGHPATTWATLLEDAPCWYDADASSGKPVDVNGPNVNALVNQRRIILAGGTDVKPTDRVVIVTHDGVTLAGPMRIIDVRKRVAETVVITEEQEAP